VELEPVVRNLRLAMALRWLSEAFGLALVYLLLTARLELAEIVVAVIAASLAAAFRIGVASSAERRFAWPFWRRPALAEVIRDLARDSITVAAALIAALARAQPLRGSFVRSRFAARGETAEQATRRAEATFLISLAPNSYVVDVDERRRQILVHQLVADRPAIQRSLARLRR
jgi:multisubunit Na+/H+ antiporter MnhE subunit